jgi:superfamily II DNA or RNA helicase
MDANTPREEREAIREQFSSGHYQVVCNVGVLTTGIDWDVRCIILARPTKSEILFTQIIGRGLRTAEGKSECMILDHSDTTLRLGFVTDIHHDKLDNGKMDTESGDATPKAAPKPIECPQCHFVRAAKVNACPSCGHVPARISQVATVDGELIELGARRKANSADWAEKISFIKQLRAYAAERSKSDGWVAHSYKAKFGVWPNDPRVRYAGPAPGIDPAVRSWITARNIRFAKSKARA